MTSLWKRTQRLSFETSSASLSHFFSQPNKFMFVQFPHILQHLLTLHLLTTTVLHLLREHGFFEQCTHHKEDDSDHHTTQCVLHPWQCGVDDGGGGYRTVGVVRLSFENAGHVVQDVALGVEDELVDAVCELHTPWEEDDTLAAHLFNYTVQHELCELFAVFRRH